MTGLTGARCVGQHELFESTDYRDHQEARAICADCPAMAACLELLRDVQTVSRTMSRCGGGPGGTWAGKLLTPPKSGGRSGAPALPREHGSDRGYFQHRKNREKACAECRKAHVMAVTERKKAQVGS